MTDRPAPGEGEHSYVVVDAFTDTPLRGNPVAVFFGAEDLPASRMQEVAREMNLSEVTFVLPPGEDGDAHIRIFTPVNELPFAGHPLLGTAVALARSFGKDELHLETAVGTVAFRIRRSDAGTTTVEMGQPIPAWKRFDRAEELLVALGVPEPDLPVEIYTNGPRHVLVGLRSIPGLSEVNPDHRALAEFPDMAINCFAGTGAHWRNRMFSPAYGVVEDAATGSAAGPLAVHLARHGRAQYGEWIDIHQGVEIGRHSLMRAWAAGAGDTVTEVRVRGAGVVVASGTIYV
ncbi:trans-2,3-dihydro-3-hydroxyanthranilate isomerase [Nocardiopsis terrae]|uniref:Trans-2,3-dihydro-3-hydroxyanthranilate isomerase n=1 Tax=Nocardiopsis terrae TaxID=372655 RepID=A0ABR9HMI4_9ACTN|nr:PhzF family phenazine biosynthesis isomerase [Nocardiopsis terrae]MBE1460251.1 trans-2,3-dihydro-3-hydroxyanthranilate isomerase [Nocardiopsis terrae]GHC70481.1 trans-2,3-dihydro-3-hydroxyanthranilate isomerase [Nocardiopsis terrae]